LICIIAFGDLGDLSKKTKTFVRALRGELMSLKFARALTISAIAVGTITTLQPSFAADNDKVVGLSGMQAFYMFLTLSSLTGPQVLFVSQPQPGNDPLGCARSLKKWKPS
jgi:hypothetical protein